MDFQACFIIYITGVQKKKLWAVFHKILSVKLVNTFRIMPILFVSLIYLAQLCYL